MDPTIWAAVASGAAAVVASVVTSRVAGRASRRDSMLKWAEQLRDSEEAARREAQESRDRADRIKAQADTDVERMEAKVNALETKLGLANDLAEQLKDTLTMAAAELWRPEPDILALRRLVGRPHGINGRSA